MNNQTLSKHLQIGKYGDFELSGAIRPAETSPVVPRQGYRISTFRDRKAGLEVPVLAASISRDSLFDIFLKLLDPLGPLVDVVLETSHDCAGPNHRDLFRAGIDLPVLESHFCDYEELLLDDGCTGVAVVSANRPIEVQFDEHKLLIVYARDLRPFERILRQEGVARDDAMKLITEGAHIHLTETPYAETFRQMCYRMGVGGRKETVSW